MAARPPADLSSESLPRQAPGRPSERRAAARTAVVWAALRDAIADRADPLDVVDVGGGTGGLAVRVAELGHRVTVVDPSPDALAMLARRADERGVADRVRGVQGDLSDLVGPVGRRGTDLVLCHGVLDVVAQPAAAMAALRECLRPDGLLSLVVLQRHAAVLARAMAGQLVRARELLEGSVEDASTTAGGSGARPRRFTHAELVDLARAAGLVPETVQGVRVFADLVPGALLDAEPGATGALVELEQAAADRPELFPLATQLHMVARAGDPTGQRFSARG